MDVDDLQPAHRAGAVQQRVVHLAMAAVVVLLVDEVARDQQLAVEVGVAPRLVQPAGQAGFLVSSSMSRALLGRDKRSERTAAGGNIASWPRCASPRGCGRWFTDQHVDAGRALDADGDARAAPAGAHSAYGPGWRRTITRSSRARAAVVRRRGGGQHDGEGMRRRGRRQRAAGDRDRRDAGGNAR